MPFNERDILVDSDGDLVVDSNGDLTLATEAETLQDDVLFRLKTDHFDYRPSLFLGANLGSVLGEPNTRRTGDLIKEQIHIALTQDNRIPAGVLFVDVIPLSIDSVQIFVIITDRVGTETQPSVVTTTLSFLPSGPGDESITNTDA